MATTHALELPTGWVISSRLVAAWPIDEHHTLELWPTGRTDDGRIRWYYRLSRNRRTIFAASDICSGVGETPSTAELISTARTVLSFLTLREGDTDTEYFDTYTRAQRAWRDRFAEDLSVYTMHDQCGYCGAEDHLSPGCPAL